MLTNTVDVDAWQQMLCVRQCLLQSYFPVLITSANLHTPHICFCQNDISTSLYGISSSNKNMKNRDKTKWKQNQKISVTQLSFYSWNQAVCENQQGTQCENPLNITTIALKINWNHDCEEKEVAPSHFCSAMKYAVDSKLSWANFGVSPAKPCAGNTHQKFKHMNYFNSLIKMGKIVMA